MIRDHEIDTDREQVRQRIWGAPGGGGPHVARGMGNFAGRGTSAALIGALLGGIVVKVLAMPSSAD